MKGENGGKVWNRGREGGEKAKNTRVTCSGKGPLLPWLLLRMGTRSSLAKIGGLIIATGAGVVLVLGRLYAKLLGHCRFERTLGTEQPSAETSS